MWRRSAIILAVLCGTLAGFVIALKSRRVADNVKAYLIRVAHDQLGVETTIEHFEIQLVPPGFAVQGVEIHRPQTEQPPIRLHSGRIRIRPWPSAAGAFVVHDLELDGLSADIDLRQSAELLRPQKSGSGSRPPIDVRQLQIWNTDLTIRAQAFDLELHRLDFALTPNRGGRRVALSLGPSSYTRDGRPLDFEAQLRGQLRGTIDRPKQFNVVQAFVDFPEISISAKGGARLHDEPQLDFEIEGRAPLSRLHDWVPRLPPVDGKAEVQLMVRGTPSLPEGRVRVQIGQLAFAHNVFDTIELEATGSQDRVRIESFRVEHRNAGAVTGSGTIDLNQDGFPLILATRLHRASLPHILQMAGLEAAWVRLLFSADARVTGTLAPFRLRADVGGHVQDFAVLDRSYQDPEAGHILGVAQANLEGVVNITPWAVAVSGITIKLPSPLHVDGTLSFNTEQGLDLRASSDEMFLEEVGPIAGILFEGNGAVAATIEGPYANLTISGTVAMDGFRVYGFDLGDTMGTVVYEDMTLAVDRATIRRGDGTADGRGALNFGGSAPTVQGNVSLSNVAASDLLTSLGVDTALAQQFDSPLSGTVSVHGLLRRPGGSVELTSSVLRVHHADLGAVHISGGFGEANRLVWGTADVQPEKGALHVAVAYHSDRTLKLATQATSIPLILVRPFLGRDIFEGELGGSAEIRGPLHDLTGVIRVDVPALSVMNLNLGETHLRGTITNHQLRVDGELTDGATRLEGVVNLGRNLPFTATAALQRLNAHHLTSTLKDLPLTVSGTIFAQGDLSRPADTLADANFDSAEIALDGLNLTATQPVRLHYGQNLLHVNELLLAGGGIQISAAGTVSTSGALNLRVNGNGDLRSSTFPAELEWLHGRLEMHVRVGGTLANPLLDGTGSITNGALRLSSTGQVLEHLETHLSLSDRSIVIDSGSATLGGGTLRLGGQFLLPNRGKSELSLRADLDSISIRPLPEMYATVTGNLMLAGEPHDLLLRGNIKLDSLRYTANLDLQRLIPRRNAPPLQVSAIDPEHAVRLAIHVTAPNNLILSNNVVEAEFQADLMVTGTTERVGLIGSVNPLWAKARYRDNEYTVTRGSIDFSEEFRIFTQFDIRSVTRACDMDVTVDVHGNSDHYNVVPKGTDENGNVDPQDVLSCVQFGLRIHEFEEQLRATNHEEEEGSPLNNPLVASSLNTIWTVTGMDAKVRKLLPIKLDEMRLESGWSSHYHRTTTRVRVGKEINTNLQLKYARAIDEIDDQTLSVEYQLSDVAALEGTWLSASNVSMGDFGLDLRLRWEFR